MKRTLACLPIVALISGPIAISSVRAQQLGDQLLGSRQVQIEEATGDELAPPAGGVELDTLLNGPLPSDRRELEDDKARAAQELREGAAVATEPEQSTPWTFTLAAPAVLAARAGVFDSAHSPSDSTGAIGPTRYIETVNDYVGIYDRNFNILEQDTLTTLWGSGSAGVTDPQIIWDATTNRFYYTGLTLSASGNALTFGFSRSGSPNTATVADWCKYRLPYGSNLPDYPKLGDSQGFAIIGVNVFNTSSSYLGSDIVAISKPPAGSVCPAGNTFKVGGTSAISIGGAKKFTPVPANEIDTNATGWVVARNGSLPATTLGIFKVTKNISTGAPVFAAVGNVSVPSYAVPPNVPQNGSSFLIDSLDARPTQAVAAVDPLHLSRLALWTQHTIKGGAGAMVRWYEIDPAALAVLQTGAVSSASLFYFNAAVSPDRVVSGSTTAYGGNMVLNFNSSSGAAFPAIRMVSKLGAGAVSAPVLVQQSPGPDIDFSCQLPPKSCRWGDYSGASPDPNAPTGAAAGIVWSTQMRTLDGRTTGGTSGSSWRTWNWKASP